MRQNTYKNIKMTEMSGMCRECRDWVFPYWGKWGNSRAIVGQLMLNTLKSMNKYIKIFRKNIDSQNCINCTIIAPSLHHHFVCV